jgi:hypothetical protein
MSTLPCSITEFARLVGRDPNTVSNRLKAGMPVVGTVKQDVKATIDQPKGLKWLYARERDKQSLCGTVTLAECASRQSSSR